MMKGKICFIELNISIGNNFLSDKIIDFISLFTIRISKKNTRITSGGKLVSIVFRGGNEAKRAKRPKVRVRGSLTM